MFLSSARQSKRLSAAVLAFAASGIAMTGGMSAAAASGGGYAPTPVPVHPMPQSPPAGASPKAFHPVPAPHGTIPKAAPGSRATRPAAPTVVPGLGIDDSDDGSSPGT